MAPGADLRRDVSLAFQAVVQLERELQAVKKECTELRLGFKSNDSGASDERTERNRVGEGTDGGSVPLERFDSDDSMQTQLKVVRLQHEISA